jgi:hypothetical protein
MTDSQAARDRLAFERDREAHACAGQAATATGWRAHPRAAAAQGAAGRARQAAENRRAIVTDSPTGLRSSHASPTQADRARTVLQQLASELVALVAARDAVGADAFGLMLSLWQSAAAHALGIDVAGAMNEALSSGALQTLGAVSTLAECGTAFEALCRIDPSAAEAVVLQIESAVRFAQAERRAGAPPVHLARQ